VDDVEALERVACDDDSLVAGHAKWALDEIRSRLDG